MTVHQELEVSIQLTSASLLELGVLRAKPMFAGQRRQSDLGVLGPQRAMEIDKVLVPLQHATDDLVVARDLDHKRLSSLS